MSYIYQQTSVFISFHLAYSQGMKCTKENNWAAADPKGIKKMCAQTREDCHCFVDKINLIMQYFCLLFAILNKLRTIWIISSYFLFASELWFFFFFFSFCYITGSLNVWIFFIHSFSLRYFDSFSCQLRIISHSYFYILFQTCFFFCIGNFLSFLLKNNYPYIIALTHLILFK